MNLSVTGSQKVGSSSLPSSTKSNNINSNQSQDMSRYVKKREHQHYPFSLLRGSAPSGEIFRYFRNDFTCSATHWADATA